MPKIMVADRPISVLHHGQNAYRPDGKGEFTIEDTHVDGVRKHGLMFPAELEAKRAKSKPKSEPAAAETKA